ncbi:hypothetical protein B5C34_13590 [Pacificimonas flava]|uniref:DNA (cytosine-5-)-methyltransferase n=2 Tax=Pacificimonas TaxID=1960290 RepID=A0A219B990_9SPHN|nr:MULTISPECIES: hypothetical protein [Pacificimonas]MBZ6379857.1 hypothetical protein [Pacificimonas aurantium]OWV34389.1 hypothetical protein B5C34_13590 [Pacificimonas flava]
MRKFGSSRSRVTYQPAADILDFSIPCPSIFERARPLKPATCKRIAAGIARFVLNDPQPFIVPITHTKSQLRPDPASDPLRTITTAKGGELAPATPYLTHLTHHGGDRVHSVEGAIPTVTGAHRGEIAMVAPSLIQMGYGEREGQKPRVLDIDKPLGTAVAGGNKFALVSAFMEQANTGMVGHRADKPLSTIVGRGTTQRLVTSNLVKLRNNQTAGSVEDPLGTITSGGGHFGEVRAFLVKYYGTAIGQRLADPLGAVTTRDRFGLVTTTIDGATYALADIGLRMLTPRELARAQGFPDDYILDPVCTYTTESGREKTGPLPKTYQIRGIGNSVCRVVPRALVRANLPEYCEERMAA